MYQKVLTPAATYAITPARLAAFGRFDAPQQYVTDSSPAVLTDDYALMETFIAAAYEQVEILAQWAIQTQQVVESADFFPNTQDPRNLLQYEMSYSYALTNTPWWWYGFPAKDSVELVRRPVQIPAYTGEAVAVTAVSVTNNVVTVTTALNPAVGAVVILNNTAEGNLTDPSATPSTTPFLNGVPLTVLTASNTEFTAAFNNFYTMSNAAVVTPGTYSNNSDTGTAQVWSNAFVIQYYDPNGVLNTWNSTNYYVLDNKVGLAVGQWWPLTDRRQDCIQMIYWAGNIATITTPQQEAKLQMAVLYLANHMWNVRDIIAVEPTSEIHKTLCLMLSSYRTFRIAR
jgi:hypothetical protein